MDCLLPWETFFLPEEDDKDEGDLSLSPGPARNFPLGCCGTEEDEEKEDMQKEKGGRGKEGK